MPRSSSRTGPRAGGTAFIWAFVGQSLTGYAFALTRGGDVPLNLLGTSTGVFLCDDYRGYDPAPRRADLFYEAVSDA